MLLLLHYCASEVGILTCRVPDHAIFFSKCMMVDKDRMKISKNYTEKVHFGLGLPGRAVLSMFFFFSPKNLFRDILL